MRPKCGSAVTRIAMPVSERSTPTTVTGLLRSPRKRAEKTTTTTGMVAMISAVLGAEVSCRPMVSQTK